MKWIRRAAVATAALMVAVWAVLSLLGWADATVVLTGSWVPEDPVWAATKALAYATSWLTMVIFAPILAGGSLLWVVVDRWLEPGDAVSTP